MSYKDAKPDSFTELKEEAMNMLEDEAFPKIIAVDFDGTLCENQYPEIGEANETMISHIKLEKFRGSKIILWTCRNGKLLEDAVKWCEERCLEFDAVNENLPYIIEQFGGDTRKIFANEYIDDRNVMFFDASCPKCGIRTVEYTPIDNIGIIPESELPLYKYYQQHKNNTPSYEGRSISMKEFIAKNPKQLDICLKLLYAEKVGFNVKVKETDKHRITYEIIADTDAQTYELLREKYRILTS